MTLTTTKRLKEQVAFKTPQDALRAIQQHQHLKIQVLEIATSQDLQSLTKSLMSLPRPFGIVIVTPKES